MKRYVALLILCATLLALPFGAFAGSSESREVETRTWVSPMFDGLLMPESIPFETKDQITASTTVDSLNEAAEYLRAQLKKHTGTVEVTIRTVYCGSEDTFLLWFNRLYNLACVHTGDPKEGDYIKWGIYAYTLGGTYGGNATTFRISPRYFATAAQERVVDTKVAELIDELELPRENDYYTLKALYDWACANITYDWDHLNACSDPNDPDYYFLMHSAYAAIVDRTCVCQGYATLLYRVGLEIGLEGRLCSSAVQNHVWNVFELGDLYFECDATWDAGTEPDGYQFFLRGKTSWLDLHDLNPGDATIGDEYWDGDSDFETLHPLSYSDFSFDEHMLQLYPVRKSNGWPLGDGNGVYYSFTSLYQYSITPPSFQWYRPVNPVVTGTMPTHDTTVEVQYVSDGVYAELVNGGIEFTWTPAEGADSYRVYRSRFGSNPELIAVVSGTSYTDTDVEPNTRYGYQVAADGCESDKVQITTGRFLDVLPSASYYNAVNWAVENGIVNGTSDSTFSPGAPCTRAQFALMLYRLAGKPAVDMSTNPFTDLPNNAGIKRAIVWAYSEGIVNGTGPTTFSPNKNITRAQLALMLYKLAGKPGVEGLECPFEDLDGLTGNNVKAVIWAYSKGIVKGTSATTFSPRNNCTRGQLVLMLYRYNRIYQMIIG